LKGPHVRFEPPARTSLAIEPPPLSAAGATLLDFRAYGDDAAAAAEGCVATPIPGWVEDMRVAVEARSLAFAGAVAERLVHEPVDARPSAGTFELRRASDLGGPLVGRAKTFLGFDDSARLFTCFAICRGPDAACLGPVSAASLDGASPPPAPGVALRSLTWAVHHPSPFALGSAVAIVLLAAAFVRTRRKPRMRRM
jgi:hypothetical protein